MPRQVIGHIPDFTSEDGVNQEEVKQPETESLEEEVLGEEKETLPESSTGEKPADETSEEEISEEETSEEEVVGEDTGEEKVRPEDIEGLKKERERLLSEIRELRATRRELKTKPKEEPITQKEIDDLKDLHPEDVALIERILKAKGYVSREELNRQLYEQIEQDEINKFLEKHPEFKPENDPDDRNWMALQEELKWYRKPENPREIGKLLEKARRAIQSPVSERSNLKTTKRQIEIASKGSGGVAQRSSSSRPFTEEERNLYRRGGWSEEEIEELEKSRG